MTGFTFFESYYDVIKELDEDAQSVMLKAIMRYVFDDVEPELEKSLSLLFILMRPTLDKSKNRSHKGISGRKKSNENQNENKPKSNTSLDKDMDMDKEMDKEIQSARARGVPPKIEEVIAYCRERNNNVDPHAWYNFYTSKGWMIGKNRMKDWKAAIRTWESKEGRSGVPPDKNRFNRFPQQEYNFADLKAKLVANR